MTQNIPSSLSKARISQTALTFPSSGAAPPIVSPLFQSPHSFQPVPIPFTRLIGREQEIKEVCDLLTRPEVRLVTLTGIAGIGKTRLARQIMAELEGTFPAGCYFVSLEAVQAVELVIPTIIQALGLPRAEHHSFFEHLVTFLHHQHVLLILDNFEQLVATAPMLVDLLSACPNVKLLVTSRAVLRVQGEYQFLVPPLALPDPTHFPDYKQVGEYPAIALFVERATAAKHTFQLTETIARPLVEICTRLDGIPLAIELAAARVRFLSPAALLQRLEHRLAVLTGGGPDLPHRQQTMRSTLTWSYDLLSPEEQWLFRHLAVFMRGCQLEAIETLCAVLGSPVTSVLDGIASLLAQNLLALSEQPAGEPRLYLFETLREYGLECLVACGELEQARQAHAAYYRSLAEEAEPSLFGFPPTRWLDQIERESGNVRAALEWCLEQGKKEAALRLAGVLGGFWFFRGNLSEGRDFLERVLATSSVSGASESLKMQAHVLYSASWLALWQLDFSQAGPYLAESLQHFQALHDPRGCAAVLNLLSTIEETRGNLSAAESLSKEALQLCQTVGEQQGIAAILLTQGMQALFQGEVAITQKRCAESLALFQKLDDSWGVAASLHYLGWASYCLGEVETARQQSEESVARLRAFSIPSLTAEAITILGYEATTQGEEGLAASLFEEALMLGQAVRNPITIARVLCGLGHLALRQEQAAKARSSFEESLNLLKGMEGFVRARWVFASCLEGMGEIAWVQGNAVWAARLLSAAQAQYNRHTQTFSLSAIHPGYDRTLAAVRVQFSEATFARLWAEGQALSPEHILAGEGAALQVEQTSEIPPQATTLLSPPHHRLTARETRVLLLIAAGLTNKQIAEQLVLSVHTVSVHVQAVYRKLGISSRSQATSYAINHHLI